MICIIYDIFCNIFYIAYYLHDIWLHLHFFDITYIYIYMHVINARSHTSHCFWLPPVQRLCFPGAIFEFFDGLPDMHVLIPKWVMEDLAIDERLWCAKGLSSGIVDAPNGVL